MGQAGLAEPVHTVNLSAFYMGKYEITNTEYCAFLNSAGNLTEGGVTWWKPTNDVYNGINNAIPFTVKTGYENRPVVYMSWYGAVAYCNWRSELDGLQKCYGDYQADGLARWGTNGANYHPANTGYRLPSEAEWEYACRGNPVQYTSYYWGDIIDGNYCWYV